MALGAVVSCVIVLAHSKRTEGLFDSLIMKIAFIRRGFWLGSVLQTLRSISRMMS